jgi:hypothetical protein
MAALCFKTFMAVISKYFDRGYCDNDVNDVKMFNKINKCKQDFLNAKCSNLWYVAGLTNIHYIRLTGSKEANALAYF